MTLTVCMFEVPGGGSGAAAWPAGDGGEAAHLGPDAGHEAGLPELPGLASLGPRPLSVPPVRLAHVRGSLCKTGGSQEKCAQR